MRVPGLIFAAALVLIGAIVLQVGVPQRRARTVERKSLARAVPVALDGWTVRDEALGQTEAGNDAVLKTLNLDDYVYRRYTKGAQWFSIYVAYWSPGKMPTQLVASHTPDRCWTENGMRCVDMRFRHNYALFDRRLLPAEDRTFTTAEGRETTFVAYWHVVGGKAYDYGSRFNAVPDPWRWWKDAVAQVAHGAREQLFVRIVSSIPLDRLWQEREFQSVMTQVADLGLWDATPQLGAWSATR